MLVLRHGMGSSLVVGSGGHSLVVLRRLLLMGTALVGEQELLEGAGFSSHGAWAQSAKNLPAMQEIWVHFLD